MWLPETRILKQFLKPAGSRGPEGCPPIKNRGQGPWYINTGMEDRDGTDRVFLPGLPAKILNRCHNTHEDPGDHVGQAPGRQPVARVL